MRLLRQRWLTEMTSKTNKRFIWIGASGFGLLFALAGLNGAIPFAGFDNASFQQFLSTLMPFLASASFFCLFVCGFMPRAASILFRDSPPVQGQYRDYLAELKEYNRFEKLWLVIENENVRDIGGDPK